MTYLLAIGTKKGLFTAVSDDRESWRVTGPIQLGGDASTLQSGVYAVGIDTRRDTPRLLVGADSAHFGPSVWHSDDLGATWTEPADNAPIALPAGADKSFARCWQFAFGLDPDVVYAGGEPHSFFQSNDGGLTFTMNQAFWDHPHRPTLFPGAGGAAIHTILPHPTDPAKISIAMSGGGFYRTDDGGDSWNPYNQGIRADFFPDPYPEYGQCVHKAARAAGDPNRMYVQNHGGVYRSDDEGGKWTSIADGLPCDFGFAIVAHPHRTDTVINFPINADANRFLPDNQLQAWRSDDGGDTWRSVSHGLPTDPYFGIVLRDAASTDGEQVPGYYFGTRCGDVFSTTEDSEKWTQVTSHLPDVLCVRAARV
ncbi:MAG TPA: exo-alpha-sialidase [Stackebrandtia sp.]|jgi:hypothetical protein|uniref:WD40/YVTN/BNR-like repeat-containing protein n=1 Tax=Stackebrandtia sp. TaxID=2023065 RepID=UPI002D33659D|nr:exo-alpha-sialidase [Stackebrandtia sp.]HZE41992.1 exo-alpha-sialidase [Stackebrandtia sp.]